MRKIMMKIAPHLISVVSVGLICVVPVSVLRAADTQVRIDNDDIGGVVTSVKGVEAGVWVIAETGDLPTTFRKIVVTDEKGRYVIPDLPKADYEIFVRGYGLVDSPMVKSTPGKILNLTAITAPNAREAAEYYPPNYWYSLLQIPDEKEFPGTGLGPGGNGIPPGMASQKHWIGGVARACLTCHQMGNKATREIPKSLGALDSSVAAWEQRIQSGVMGPGMSATMAKFGRRRGLQMFADWTDRIAAGEVPPTPPRPQGLERNIVVTLWDWADPYSFIHDTISTDKRDPTLNANGIVYGVGRFSNSPDVFMVDPERHSASAIAAPIRDADTPFPAPQLMTHPSLYWGNEIIWKSKASLHNPMIDHKGRVWFTHQFRSPEKQPDFCLPGSSHPSAQLFPLPRLLGNSREVSLYDPKTQKWTFVDTCFGTHHLQFANDANNTLWMSGGGEVIGWVNTKLFEETGDAKRAQGWTAFVLDTNGNGKRDAYVEPNEPIDPSKDKRISNDSTGGSYGIIHNPVDGSVWVAAEGMPGAIYRFDPGNNPPETTLTEIYEPPFNNPKSPVSGYTPRGIDVDSNGLIWTALAGSGHIASFDRRKCKVLNGPTATGQHCPEGWTLYQVPGPKFKGVTDPITTNFLYYIWVDQHNVLGLGANVPIATGTGSEALIALLPDGHFVELRVPYPMGFYHRGIDGRIDDPKISWKGRGLWANFGSYVPWHNEGGKGTTSKAVKFQLRPNPLAK